VFILQYQKDQNKCCVKIAETSVVLTMALILLPFLSVALHESGITNALLGP